MRPLRRSGGVEEREHLFDDLRRHEASVHSQCGEDGVLLRLFDRIGPTNRFFVEFGAKDGRHWSNTANLRLHHGWSGLLMEGGERAVEPLVKREFVTAENVNALFEKYRVPATFDLLSIDIDGNDYWIWQAIDRFVPRVVVIEYNIFFHPGACLTIPYRADFVWDEGTFHGASLAALRKLGSEKGYALVYADRWAPNAFFVQRQELPDDFEELPVERVTPWDRFVRPPGFDESAWLEV